MPLPYDQALIIIPTYNEAENIERMVRTLFGLSTQLSVLIIDDGSPDGTSQIVSKLKTEFARLFIINRAGKLGLGTAYVAGFKWALEKNYEYIFEMDCDFSHDPADVPRLLEAALENDLVIGSRYIEGVRVINWAAKRLFLSLFASLYTRTITGMPLKDPTGGFKCFRRSALQALDLDRVLFKGYAFQIELNYKVWCRGLKIREVPIIFYERREGQSKMNRGLVVEASIGVFRLKLMRVLGRM